MASDLPNSICFALIGGSLISLSSSLNYIFFGKITGLSGYLFKALSFHLDSIHITRFSFLIGLISTVDTFARFYGSTLYSQVLLDAETPFNPILIITGSLLVGIGVRWGGGCTSGHGVCGLPRLSKRSFIAVPVFMSTGVLTATLLSLLGPVAPQVFIPDLIKATYLYIPIFILHALQTCTVGLIVYSMYKQEKMVEKLAPMFFLFTGCVFGAGLLISGMCSRSKILGFLTISENWDPSLMFVMASAVSLNFVTFQLVMRRNRAVWEENIDLPDQYVDKGIFAGPALFGIGWGITGFCPGPALANMTVLGFALTSVVFISIGQILHDFVDEKMNSPSEIKDSLIVSN